MLFRRNPYLHLRRLGAACGLPSCAGCGACEQPGTSPCRTARHMPRMLHALHAAVSWHSLQTSHPTPITQLEASWRGQDRVCRQHGVPLGPAGGGALARGPTGRAPCGPLRLALRWPLVRSPPARLPPPACTGRRSACQADGHRGVAATRGMTLWPAGRLPWWTSVAGTARAGEKAHARA
jgi:hypothetical protein